MPYDYQLITLLYAENIATISLNRPEKRNPLSVQMVRELMQAFGEAEESGQARALILTGAGKSFCAGMDASDMAGSGPFTLAEHESMVRLFDLLVLRLRTIELPTIAAVNGHALGGGFALAIACDIRVAASDAMTGAIFTRRGGSAADMGTTYILPRLIGPSRAAELMYTGEVIDAARAEGIGLFTHVVPPEQLMTEARALAGRIAAGPPLGLKFTKRALNKSVWEGLAGHIDFEAAAQTLCTMTDDFGEGWTAFFEKREPRFQGK